MGHETNNLNNTLPAPYTERAQRMLRDADLCVKCGLCLAHCPTYLNSHDEGDSPRGRIALAQGVASGRLPLTSRVHDHLSGCLVCRACEAVCPSGVSYGRLVDAARAELAVRRPPGAVRRLLRWTAAEGVIRHRPMTAVAVRMLSPFRRLLNRRSHSRAASGWWAGMMRAARYLPSVQPPGVWRAFYPATGEEQGQVALFLGCVARSVDRRTLDAAIRLLTRWGYGVHVPAAQGCCGAVYQHDGSPEEAARLAYANIEAFSGHDLQAVITTATGCGAMLAEYPGMEGLSDASRVAAGRFADKVVDISRFLAVRPWPDGEEAAPLVGRIAVHEPCTLRHVMGQGHSVCDLLRRIPDLEVVELPDNGRCCGAAGANMLTHPGMADRLATEKLDALADTQADKLVTSNIGCALHLAAVLRSRGDDVEVLHPATLLDRQMTGAGD